MKILIASDWYKPVINGVVTSIDSLTKGLVEAGHEVKILTLSPNHSSRKEDNVYFIASFSVEKIYPNARIKLHRGSELIQELIAWKPDVIHTQCEFSTFLLAQKIAKHTGAAIIHTYHTEYEGYTHYFCPSKRLGRKIVEKFSRTITKRTDAVIVPSEKMKDMLNDYRVRVPLYVIPSGIEMSEFEKDDDEARMQIRKNLGIPEEECILVYVGRLAKEKKVEEILNYLSDPELADFRLLIVGDGPYREELERIVEKNKIRDRVIFTGMVEPSKVADYYRAGDIFVCASDSETQGMTYMEAMASALPIVCRQDECLDDVVDEGKNGFTYQNEREFQTTIKKLSEDKQLRQQVGSQARDSVEKKFSADSFADECAEVYQSIKNNN